MEKTPCEAGRQQGGRELLGEGLPWLKEGEYPHERGDASRNECYRSRQGYLVHSSRWAGSGQLTHRPLEAVRPEFQDLSQGTLAARWPRTPKQPANHLPAGPRRLTFGSRWPGGPLGNEGQDSILLESPDGPVLGL